MIVGGTITFGGSILFGVLKISKRNLLIMFAFESIRWILVAPAYAFAALFAMRANGFLAFNFQDRMDLPKS